MSIAQSEVLSHMSGRSTTPVAIIGMSGRFPGAANVNDLWDLLLSGAEGVAVAPSDRPWMHDLFDRTSRAPGKVPTSRGGFLSNLDLFDAQFFNMSAKEARHSDPQLRLLLENSYESVQDAGLSSRSLAEMRTGVFFGSNGNDYWLRHVPDLECLDLYADLGAAQRGSLSGRVAYALNLSGPAITVDAACSSSLAAIHLACQSIRIGECDAALAGGSNLILSPNNTITFARAGALSPDGRCKFGDASADGFVRSEASGVVLLKPLEKALSDNDRIRAVILGSAANNDGFTQAGMASPSTERQEQVLRTAYASAGIDPQEVAFVEAHGTGTPAGDRAELTALARVLGARGPAGEPCLVGSAKSCLGHTEAAAGVVGLIKAVMCLERRQFPGNPQLTELTQEIDWDSTRLNLPSLTTELPLDRDLIVGGVNSFGATGTNVHIVLGSAANRYFASRPEGGGPVILTLSARSAAALADLAESYLAVLDGAAGELVAPRELCSASAIRRDHFEHRVAITGNSTRELADGIRQYSTGHLSGMVSVSDGAVRRPRVVFTFPGQGAQWRGMGKEILEESAVFREKMEECHDIIRDLSGWSLIDSLTSDDDSWLEETRKVQPALWAFGVSLADLWNSWGIRPDFVMGQSQGEIAAAQWGGALTARQAGELSCVRAELVDTRAPSGAMCWVERPYTQLELLLEKLRITVSTAVVESPTSTVVSGTCDEIERVIHECSQRNIACQRVDVGYAAHSSELDRLRQPLLEHLARLIPSATSTPFISTVTGSEMPGEMLDRDYWWRNLREPVRLDQGVKELCGERSVVFLQMAPHPVLTRSLTENINSSGMAGVAVGSLRRHKPELDSLYRGLAALYSTGVDPDWNNVFGGENPGFIELPKYPWQRTQHWHQASDYPWPAIDSRPQTQTPPGLGASESQVKPTCPATAPHPWLSREDEGADGSRSWEGHLDPHRDRFLLGHRVLGQPIMPGAGYLELAGAVGRQLVGTGSIEVHDIAFREMLPLSEGHLNDVGLRVTARREGASWQLIMEGRRNPSAPWTRHAVAHLTATAAPESLPAGPEDLAAVRIGCPEWLAGDQFYRDHSDNGWLGAFRGIAELWLGRDEAVARLRPEAGDYLMHPATMDAALQTAVALGSTAGIAGPRGLLLVGIDRVRLHRTHTSGPLWAHTRRSPLNTDASRVDITLLDDSGATLAEFDGVQITELPASADVPTAGTTPASDWYYAVEWEEITHARVETEPTDQHWLLICGGDELDELVADQLVAEGCLVSIIRHGSTFVAEGPGRARADLSDETDLASAITALGVRGSFTGVADLRPCSVQTDEAASVRKVQWTATDVCFGLLPLARTLRSLPHTPKLCLLTRGARAAVGSDTCPRPWQAPLWAFSQVLSLEEKHRILSLDLEEQGVNDRVEAAQVTSWLLADLPDAQLALRGGRLLAPRLRRTGPPAQETPRTPADALQDGTSEDPTRREPGKTTRLDLGPNEGGVEAPDGESNLRGFASTSGTRTAEHNTAPSRRGRYSEGITPPGPGAETLAPREAHSALARPASYSSVVIDGRSVGQSRAVPRRETASIRSDRTYLITGGLSGVGALAAQWLLDQGARYLLLIGRTRIDPSASSAASVQVLNRLRAAGARVEYAAVDVADAEALAVVLLRREREGLPAVSGVIHSAAVVEPSPALDLCRRDIDAVLRPKVAGGWALHTLFADQRLDFFVCFSSAVSVLSQLTLSTQLAAYAAGNAFLDALTTYRRAAGLPSTTINWGYWTQTGLAHRLSLAIGHDVRPRGMGRIDPADVTAVLPAILTADEQVVCVPADWAEYFEAYPQDAQVPLLADLAPGPRASRLSPFADDQTVPAPHRPGRPPGPAPTASIGVQLDPGASATSAEAEKQTRGAVGDIAAIGDWLAGQLANVLEQSAEDVDRNRPLNTLGLDSLMATDLRTRTVRHLGYELPLSRILGGASVRDLAADITTSLTTGALA